MTGYTSSDPIVKFTGVREISHDLVVVANKTTTHFHPEHAFGAQVFAGKATYMVDRQVDDLARQPCQRRVPEDA